MPAMDDRIYDCFVAKGFEGGRVNAEKEYLEDAGYPGVSLQDKWKALYIFNSVQDRKAFFDGIGYTGDITEQTIQWCNDSCPSIISASHLLLEDGFFFLLEDGGKLILE